MSHSDSDLSDDETSSISSDEDSLFTSSDGSSLDKFVFSHDTANDNAGEKMSPMDARLYDLNTRAITERGRTLGAEIYRILKDSEGISKATTDQLGGLLAEAEALSQFELQAEVKIGFIGDQGAGKLQSRVLWSLWLTTSNRQEQHHKLLHELRQASAHSKKTWTISCHYQVANHDQGKLRVLRHFRAD
jgi:hypothetical protein